MTAGEIGERMTSREFTAWVAFDQIDPLPDTRLDQLAAMVATVVNRSMGGKAKATDFVPKWDYQPPTSREFLSQWQAFAVKHNSNLKRLRSSVPTASSPAKHSLQSPVASRK